MVLAELDDLEEQYSIISADTILDASQIGRVTEDAELWRQAVTPNIGVPDSAEFVYTKHRGHWLLTFPIEHPEHKCTVPHLVRIQQDARGVWTARLSQPEVYREWYYNGSKRMYATKYYKGQDKPDESTTMKVRGKEIYRYIKIAGMPSITITQHTDKEACFLAAEKYIIDTYGTGLNRLLSKNAMWRYSNTSAGQRRVLKKMRKAGIALPEEINSGTASVLVDRFFLGYLQPTKLKKRK